MFYYCLYTELWECISICQHPILKSKYLIIFLPMKFCCLLRFIYNWGRVLDCMDKTEQVGVAIMQCV